MGKPCNSALLSTFASGLLWGLVLPRFYIHYHDGDGGYLDAEGMEFPDLIEACLAFRQVIEDLLEAAPDTSREGKHFEIEDPWGRCTIVRFEDVVREPTSIASAREHRV